jgi:hypothetical protein
MLIYSGIEYIGSETFSKKSDAKDRIVRSVGALVLIFSAFIFFDQLNPELLKVRFEPIKTSPDKVQINSISDIWSDDNFSDFDTTRRLNRFEKAGYHKPSDSCSYPNG